MFRKICVTMPPTTCVWRPACRWYRHDEEREHRRRGFQYYTFQTRSQKEGGWVDKDYFGKKSINFIEKIVQVFF